ncbi:PilZ domain-containing protein [Sphingomonas sp.]|uniref:PilZ domain-containing protein n=1 Tax=Sphingomonas sp. TaxID=28214 RepID=UPI003B3A8757
MERSFSPEEPQRDEDARYAHLRSEPRDSMFLMATMRRAGGPDVTVKVRNLSGGGLMAESPVTFLRDERVEVELRGIGTVAGRIAWFAAGRLGIAFDTPVDPRLARKPVTGNPQPQLVQASRTMWRPGIR